MSTPRYATLYCLVLGLVLGVGQASAGTTPVHIESETGGDVDTGLASEWDGSFENVNGCIFWDGTAWTTDATSAHKYFTNLETGERIKIHHLFPIDPSPGTFGPVAGVPGGYAVTKSLYGYTKAGAAPGISYAYSAVRYDITQPDGTTVILLSRGTGNGTALPYLDAYLQEPDGTGNTTAIQGDPVMLRYLGMTPAQAILVTPDLGGASVRASLPTCSPTGEAQYWLDKDGGSDMGGITWYLRTECLSPVRTAHWGSAFPVELRIMFTNATDGEIYDLVFLPALAGETAEGAAAAVPALGRWAALALAGVLLLLAVRALL